VFCDTISRNNISFPTRKIQSRVDISLEAEAKVNNYSESRFPALMQWSTYLSFVTFVCAFPLSIVVDLYHSFGNFNAHSNFITFRLSLFFLVIVVGGLNLVINTSHWLRLLSFGCYLLLYLYILVVVLLYWDLEGYVGDNFLTAGSRYSPILFLYVAHCVLGVSFTQYKPFRWVLLFCLVAASVVILQHVDYNTFRIDVNNYIEDANKGNYQFIGDAFAITTLLVFAYFQNKLARIILFVGASMILFCIGSRTSFAVFGLTGLLFILVHTSRVKITLVLVVSLIVSLAAGAGVLGVFSTSINIDDLEERNSRMIGIFTGYEEDGSIIGRKERDDEGWEDISNSPITGNFGGQRAVSVSDWNGYMHNFFSYWRQFGIVPFSMLLALYALFFALCLKMRKYKDSLFFTIPFLLGAFIIVESVISRSFVFVSTHLFFGLLVSFHAWNMYGSSFLNTGGGTRRKRRRRRRSSVRLSDSVNDV